MNEKAEHRAICNYIRLQYPGAWFKTDLSGIYLSGSRKLKAEVKNLTSHKGYPDLIIYEARGGYAGLALEIKAQGANPFKKSGGLKKQKGDHLQNQNEWLRKLRDCGYIAEFAVGFEDARQIIDDYFKKEPLTLPIVE